MTRHGDPMSRRIRVIYVIATMAVGGTQTQLIELLKALDRRRFDPALLCLTGRGELLAEAREAGLKVYSNNLPVSIAQAGLVRNLFRTASLFRRLRPHIAHCYLPRGNVVGSAAAKLAGVSVSITSKRGLHKPRSALESWGTRLADRLASRVIANAKAVAEYAIEREGCDPGKVLVIPNGVDSERFRPMDEATAMATRRALGILPPTKVVGTVTRLRSRKGLDTLAEAITAIAKAVPEARAVVVGDVPPQSLEPAMRRAGVGGRVIFTGVRRDLPELLSALDVFLLASTDGEGMPNVVLEAMACGKPVVVTDVGGSREVVPESGGVVVEPGDAQAMASSVLALFGDPERARRMGESAREEVLKRFSIPAMARATESVYLELLGGS